MEGLCWRIQTRDPSYEKNLTRVPLVHITCTWVCIFVQNPENRRKFILGAVFFGSFKQLESETILFQWNLIGKGPGPCEDFTEEVIPWYLGTRVSSQIVCHHLSFAIQNKVLWPYD